MYPSRQLIELSRRKMVLRQQIAGTRLHCAALAAEAARPLALFGRLRAQWRKISPFAKLAAIPLLLVFRGRGRKRAGGRRPGLISRVWRWLPAVLSATRMLQARPRGW